ncbi:MAG: TetR family transcriptional regulator [Myxococcota bacterium]|nr:TetR family transcriptional regulator [Myxococcota bacterium]
MLDAALAAFSELGFDGASTRAIAARAGVNQGLIPYYFGTKEALWQAAVDRAVSELGGILSAATEAEDPAAAREQLIRQLVRFAARRPEFSRLMTDEGKRDGARMRWIVDRHVKPLFEAARGPVTSATLPPGAPSDVDPVLVHYAILGAATHLFHQAPEVARVAGIDVSDPKVVSDFEDLLVALFAGAQPTERGT